MIPYALAKHDFILLDQITHVQIVTQLTTNRM